MVHSDAPPQSFPTFSEGGKLLAAGPRHAARLAPKGTGRNGARPSHTQTEGKKPKRQKPGASEVWIVVCRGAAKVPSGSRTLLRRWRRLLRATSLASNEKLKKPNRQNDYARTLSEYCRRRQAACPEWPETRNLLSESIIYFRERMCIPSQSLSLRSYLADPSPRVGLYWLTDCYPRETQTREQVKMGGI